VIVRMSTTRQAQTVAQATGGQLLTTEEGKPTNRVRLDGDFESHRAAVEAVTVLFQLATDDGTPVPSGWVLRGATFEVEWPREPGQARKIRSHFGARRFARNWALATVKANLEAKAKDPGHVMVPWTLAALRKRWNQVKHEVAPWWAENSKEAYASGIADLVVALSNWKASKEGRRKGRRVGFPRFESKHRTRNRVRFTTGALRLEPDRRHITLPVIGSLRSKENTRRLERHVAKGNAWLLSMTLSERWGRLFVSISYAVRTRIVARTPPLGVGKRDRAGVDLGLRTYATVADSDGLVTEFPNPAPLRATLVERRRVARQMSRRIPGSRGHRAARAKLARLDRRAVHLRREHVHQCTRFLVDHYHEVHIEDLDLAAMRRSMGRRAFRRAVGDAALGAFRPVLAYKAEDGGTRVVVADRFFASSRVHHSCGGVLVGSTKLAKTLTCRACGRSVDRDRNAALNLRDWPGHASPGPVGASAPFVPGPPRGGTGGGSDDRGTGRRTRQRKTPVSEAAAGEARTKARAKRAEEPRKRCN
jgi:putative transposase